MKKNVNRFIGSKKKDREFILDESRKKNVAPAQEEAKEFILSTLEENKQMEVKELDELAAVNGISANALKNAKAELKKESITHVWSIGYGKEKQFFIRLTDTLKPNE